MPFGVKLYAYCLMTNHVHLRLVPARPKGLALLLKHLAARQTRYVNTIEGRTGTLWEGRYKSSPVETETYLLACSRTIEHNPVRAGIVRVRRLIAGRAIVGRFGLWQDPGTDLNPCYEALGATEQSRRNRYREFVGVGVLPSEQTLIREALHRGQLTGTQRFADEIERKLSIRVEHRAEDALKGLKNKSVPFSVVFHPFFIEESGTDNGFLHNL